MSDTSPQGVQDDAVNPNAAPPYVEFAGPTNIGWYYAPTVSYTLTGIFSYFRPVPNGTGTRTMTVQIWTDREAAGGTLLAQATFTADSDTGGLLGADFAPVTIQSGQTYFVDFLNSEGMGVDLGQYQIVDGVEEPSAGATTLLSAFYGTSAAGDDTFSGGPLHGDVVTGGGPVSFEEPILYFYGPGAAPVVNTATPIDFGNVHPGANLPLSIGNAASATTGLDASVGGTSGDAVATGSVTQLVPGGTDDSIGVGLGGSAVGAQTGSVTLDFASDSGSGTPTALPSQTIQLSGTVYREAAATIAPIDEIVHVGDAGSVALGVANSDPADGFSENLIATLTDATGGLSVTGGGPTGELAPGQSDPDAFALGFSTAQAATIAGTADVGLVSDGGTGVGSIDGLGETTLTPDAVPVTITVDNYAQPAFDLENDGGTGAAITGSGADYVLNLGTIAQGSGDLTLGIGALNAASGPADLLSGSLSASGSGAIMASGLGGFADLAAGQAGPAGTVTVDTTATGSFSETLTLRSQGSNASGYSAALPDETLTVEGTVAPLAAPVVSAPKSQTVFAGMAAVLGPISITDADAGDGPVTVVISDVSGILSAAATVGSVTVSGNDSRTLTLIGSLADVNAELASLTYTGQSSPDSDSVTFVATDSSHATTSTDLQLTIGSVALSPPVLNLPPTLAVVAGTTSALGGLSVTDPYAEATGEPLSVQLTFGPQTVLSETGNSGATVTGVGTNTITLSGSLDQINADLSDPPLLENPLGLALTLEEVQFIQYLAGPGSLINNQTFINGGPVFFGNLVLRAAESLINEYGSITAAIANFHAVTGGGAILDTFSGQTYSFQGAGEYLLAAATQQGDSFEVQARFQPFDNSAFISVMTQIAAAIGSDRVTFGIGRADTVWVDGAAAALGVGTSMSLSGGQLTQLSSDSYELIWNTGETLTVTNEGTYLDLNVGLGSGDGPGSVAGLLGPNEGIANDFTLPDGTELQEPISSTELYQTFANSWRIPQQFSLFDYATGQTTATFTDATFPAQAPSLADLPASVVAQAASVVAAAGITIPALQSIVELDYIETGDPGIVTTDAALFNGISVAAGQVSAGGPAALAIGVEASGQQQANADEQVTFTVYLTAAAIADTTVDYQLETPDATFLTAAAFGGIAPSGQVVIPAGQTTSTFTITVPLSALGTSASANLGVQISSPASVPLVVPTAQTTIVNPPAPGPPPEPEIAPLFSFGTFTHIGNDYTLSLGALQFGQFLPTLQFAVINAAAAGADELGGTFTVAPSVGFTVSGASLPQPIAAGQDYEGLTLTPTETKIDSESTETITFTPVDTNPSGYSATLAPLTLTITDTIVPPTMYYSEAWGDVHIVTYNGLAYDFQAAGEFILAQSSLPDDSFDIQLRLQPFSRNPVVSGITQVAISLGADRVTFGLGRQDFVQVDDAPTSLSLSDPVLSLPGGKIVEISPGQFQVTWNTGEEMTVTSFGSFLDVTDGIPFAELGHVAGLQGEGEGQANDFQLPDGTVLAQPLTTAELYGEYADAWRVTTANTLFDYLQGQSTATFTDPNFPADAIALADLLASEAAAAAKLVAAAGITDQGIADAAEYDYLATGDPTFIDAAADVSQTGFVTTPATVTPSGPPPSILSVMAATPGVVAASIGSTPVTFDVSLNQPTETATVVDYAVTAPGSGFFDASTFGGTLPTGQITLLAGQTSGQFTIDVPQGALGSLPSENLQATISTPSGVQLFAPSAQASVVNNVAEPGPPAAAMLAELAGGGSFAFDPVTNTYTLDLGVLTPAQAEQPVQFAVVNTGEAGADDLSGTFTAPLGSGFTITGNDLPGAIAAGQDYEGLYALPLTNAYGTNSETLTFAPKDINDSGYSAALPTITLVVQDVVEPPPSASVNTPGSVLFPAVHVGTAETQAVSITNTATAPAASLDVSPTASGAATVSGDITDLAPGATDATGISVGLDTGTAGAQSGAVSLDLGSDDGGGSATPLPTGTDVDVFGAVYREAAAEIAPVSAIVHVGDTGVVPLSVTNTDPADGYSESLAAAIAATSGDIGVAPGDPPDEVAPGQTDDRTLAVAFSTAAAGTVSGTATVSLASDGGTGAGSIDGLGETALPDEQVPVTITVDNYAEAAVGSSGNLTPNGQGSYTLDLGSTVQGSAPLAATLTAANVAPGPADWLDGSFAVSGSQQFQNSGLGPFSQLAAGSSVEAGTVSLATNQVGSFTETIDLSTIDANASGFSQSQGDPTILVTGTITPAAGGGATPTATAGGDVHMVTFDGLHYDFQATGDFVLARSTRPGDSFQIQMTASALPGHDGVSYATEIAAMVGGDRVTFTAGAGGDVAIDGQANAALATAGATVGLPDGRIAGTGSGDFVLTWNTGETLDVTDQGGFFNVSVTLGKDDGPGSVQGLLGSDGGQATDFALPDGTVLQQPVSSATLLGSFADAWRVTPQDSILAPAAVPAAAAPADDTIAPISAATLMPPTMRFVADAAQGASGMVGSAAGAGLLAASAGASADLLPQSVAWAAEQNGRTGSGPHPLTGPIRPAALFTLVHGDAPPAGADIAVTGASRSVH